MKPYFVSAPSREVIDAYARWKGLDEHAERNLLNDGWTLPALHFRHLYEAQQASLDIAMVSGSVLPFQPHEVTISEFVGTTDPSS